MGKNLTIFIWLIFLIAAIYFTADAWISLDGVTMTSAGRNALIIGVVLSLILGTGLMALLYHSHRIGHDEKADDLTDSKNDNLGITNMNINKPDDNIAKEDWLTKTLDRIFFWEKS